MPKALLVADATWVVNEVTAALSLGDWEIEQLSDPREAATVAGELQPDAVIVDMQVSSMGGMAVVRGIRQEFDGRTRPRLVLLLDRSADKFIARRAGADAYALKPIGASELREALAIRQPEPVGAGSSEEE